MLKNILRVVAALVGIAALSYAVLYLLGYRVMRDGSGIWPRYVSTAPDYDALEADRARQREIVESQAAAPPAPATTPAAAEAPDAEAAAGAGPAPLRARAPEWPEFRGPGRDGRYPGPIRTSWPADGLRRLWKQPIGLGYASFVIADGRAFTIEQRRHQEVVAAYDVDTGRELWNDRWDGEFVEAMGGDGPRATPTYSDGRVYALGALGELRSLDARTGTVMWRRNILEDADASNLPWGMSAAPLVVDDTVIVLPGGRSGNSVAAYSKASGDRVWRALDDQQAYVSPMLVELAGRRQVLVVSATRVTGLAPEDGELLWEFPWATDMGINVGQPLLVGGDRIFVSSGYGKGAAVFQVVRDGEGFTTRPIWQNVRMKNKFTSSLLHDGYIYGLDEAILACIDAATGELKWKGGRYGYGQTLLAAGHIVVITEDGQLTLVRATPEGHQEVARFQAIEGRTWNHPAIADGRLLVRNGREMAAFDIGPPR